jgi:hypothetical protein
MVADPFTSRAEPVSSIVGAIAVASYAIVLPLVFVATSVVYVP